MARSDTIRALERRGMARPLAAKAADAGEQLGTLKNASLVKLRKLFSFREILEVIESVGNRKVEPRGGRRWRPRRGEVGRWPLLG